MKHSEAVTLNGLIACQEGAVVSRTLLEHSSGTVTLFAFAAGQSLSEHTAPFDALVHVLEGQVDITIGDQLHHLDVGQAIIMPANVPHALYATEPLKFLLTMLREQGPQAAPASSSQ